MKEKAKKITKYVAVLLLAVCIMQTPTEASAAVTTGTEFTDDRFESEMYNNKRWIYIKDLDTEKAYLFVSENASKWEFEFYVEEDIDKYVSNLSCECHISPGSNFHVTYDNVNQSSVSYDNVYIACSGENMLVTFSGNEIYNSIPEPEVTPEPTPSETTDRVQFSDIFDATIVDVLINILKKMTHLFTIFPLNVIMIASICGIAFGLFGKAKRTATNK